jgi:hypothetical protein
MRLAGAVLLLAAVSLVTEAASGATSRIGYMPPAAQISVTDTFVSPPRTWMFHELGLFQSLRRFTGALCRVRKRRRICGRRGRQRQQSLRNRVRRVGGALAEAAVLLRNTDPQDRGTVKLNVTFKAHASAGPEPLGNPPSTSANYQLMIGY